MFKKTWSPRINLDILKAKTTPSSEKKAGRFLDSYEYLIRVLLSREYLKIYPNTELTKNLAYCEIICNEVQ